MSVIVYRLSDGSEWRGVLSYEEARDGEPRALAWLAARHSGPMQDADPSLWLEAQGPLYREGWEESQAFIRPSAVVAFQVRP